MPLPFSRPYTAYMGAPTLDRVDPLIFTSTYFAACMTCGFCHDSCCQYGADIEVPTVRALEARAGELEAYLGAPRSSWLRTAPSDFGVKEDPEFPGGAYTRTAVTPLPQGRVPGVDRACVFLHPEGRGCRLHSFAVERGFDYHEVKPLVCSLFPVTDRAGELSLATEILEEDLVCLGPGPSLYRAARGEIEHYFGPELVAELDALEAAALAEAKEGALVQLHRSAPARAT